MKTKSILPLWGGLALLLMGVSINARAGGSEVIESPIYRHATPVAISISTSAYTKVPSTARMANRTLLLIDNPSTNTALIHGHIGNCTSTSVSISLVLGPIEIAPSSNGGVIPLGTDECLWIVSRHTAAETITYQEVSQRYAP